ncbi:MULTISPECIES: hypothetical protein [unclassified Pseudomonas]|jgi:hypothetical protein|uniref:hypothetical protein n=1 Tax=unclassified Pseudomonas TaxID=196821 RepID=UPI00117AA0A7|nr:MULTISPECIES: hypothetical protein [unclassified Pseudomonas]
MDSLFFASLSLPIPIVGAVRSATSSLGGAQFSAPVSSMAACKPPKTLKVAFDLDIGGTPGQHLVCAFGAGNGAGFGLVLS